MKDVVQRLWQLQTEVSALQQRETALNTKPAGFAKLDEEFSSAKRRMEELGSRIETLQKSRRELDRETAGEQELLKKYQGQLMQAKNQVQYAAAWKEIDTARRKIKELEDESLKRMVEIEELEKELQSLKESSADLEGRHKQSYDEWQASLGELRGQADALKAKIATIETGIPDNIKREFYTVLKQRNGVAMVEILDGSCGGCRVRIRPQVVQQVKRGELGRCEGCRRMLHG